ncbi:MAG: hypothetical protein VX913_12490 [Planctomycetota bacterium]|nr:hypothetical protein [Planctomycetota bacterium]
MSAPRPLLELMDLQADVAQGRATLRVGPVRVEAPAALLATPISAPLDALLDRAWFLAPRGVEVGDSRMFEVLGALAEDKELYLDLELSGVPEPGVIPAVLGARIARLRVRVAEDASDVPVAASVELARCVSGRVVLEFTVSAEGAARVPALIAVVGRGDVPRDVHLIPMGSQAQHALSQSWDEVAEVATTHGVTVSVRGGRRVSAGPPLDPLAGANILDASVRATFRSRVSLCPFPFMTTVFTDTGVAVCPAPGGPASPHVPDGVWNAALFTDVREAFFAGDPPDACRQCTLFPRVRRSLSETPWDTGSGSTDLPVGTMEV